MTFEESIDGFWKEFNGKRIMVLSTSQNDIVTSRSVSVVAFGGKFYFQADRRSRKCIQLEANQNASLCVDNIQVEGQCVDLGLPVDNAEFCRVYSEAYAASYKRYSHLENEHLFALTPTFIERWHYINGSPHIETFNVKRKEHTLSEYCGK